MQLSSNTLLDTVSGWKLMVSQCVNTTMFLCDSTLFDFLPPPVYPNASHPNGVDYYFPPRDCRTGCLYNVLKDPRENHDRSFDQPTVKAAMLKLLQEARKTEIQTPHVPDDPECCSASI